MKKQLVKICMVDKYEAEDKWFFHLDMNNPWPTICKERAAYICHRSTARIIRMPMIALFFEVPEEKVLYVKDQLFGEVKDGKKFFLTYDAMHRPGDVIKELLSTYQQCVRIWEDWRDKEKKEDEFFDDVILACRQKLRLIQGGKS